MTTENEHPVDAATPGPTIDHKEAGASWTVEMHAVENKILEQNLSSLSITELKRKDGSLARLGLLVKVLCSALPRTYPCSIYVRRHVRR